MFDGPWETCMLVRGLTPSECASWVQAWGSIFAIIAAVLVVLLGHRLQQCAKKREEEAAYTLRLEYAYQLIDGAAKVARNIVEFTGPGLIGDDDRRAMLVEVRAYCDAIQALDKSQLKTFTLLRAVLAGDALSRKLREDLAATFVDHAAIVLLDKRQFVSKAEAIFGQLAEHGETIAIAIRDRRGTPKSEPLIGAR